MFRTEHCNVFVATDFGCTFGWGGASSIVAGTFWLVGAFLVWLVASHANQKEAMSLALQACLSQRGPRAPESAVEITETIKMDGTTVTETITTAPNGTKTIQKTVEMMPEGSGGV